MIKITENLYIPEDELRFTFSRSSKPGGQNVNKVSTRVTLWFDVKNSPSLSFEQKSLIFTQLAARINKDEKIRVVSSKHRTQLANRKSAVERFVELLCFALKEIQPRKKTRIPNAVKQNRLKEKRIRSKLKQVRKKINSNDD